MRRLAARAATVAAAALAAISAAASAALAQDLPGAERIRAVRDAVFERAEFRYGREEEEESLLRRMLAWWSEILGDVQRDHPVLFLVGLVAATLLLVVLLVHLAWTWRVSRRSRFVEDDPDDLESALRRLDPAPFRARALDEAAIGRYEDAVRDLYTALLLTLDRRGAVRYASHKALLDYRIEAGRDADAARTLDLFAATYHPGSFGRRPPDRAHFDELLAALDRVAGAPR
jgi:hypothetical protein